MAETDQDRFETVVEVVVEVVDALTLELADSTAEDVHCSLTLVPIQDRDGMNSREDCTLASAVVADDKLVQSSVNWKDKMVSGIVDGQTE